MYNVIARALRSRVREAECRLLGGMEPPNDSLWVAIACRIY